MKLTEMKEVNKTKLMRDLVIFMRIYEEDILIEDSPFNTFENVIAFKLRIGLTI